MPPAVNCDTPPPSRATRKRERTRQALLDAARQLYAEGGHATLTVADIARAADVGVGTFYYHFATKDDVLVALMAEFMGRVATAIHERGAHITDPAERLRSGYAVYVELGQEEQELLRMYYSSAGAQASFAEAGRQFFLDEAMEMIRMGQDAGVFRSGPPELLAQWFLGATRDTLQWLMTHSESLDETMVDTLTELMLGGLLGRETSPT